jgi:hypothetical protein
MISASDIKALLENSKAATVKVTIITNDAVKQITLSASAIEAVKKAGKGIIIAIKDKAGNTIATWEFKAEVLKAAKNIEAVSLLTTVKPLDKLIASSKELQLMFGDLAINGIYVNTNSLTEHQNQGTLSVSLKKISGATEGNRVYIYKINQVSRKLDMIVDGYTHFIDANGNVSFDVVAGGEYLILTQKVPFKFITSLIDQVSIKAKVKQLKVGDVAKIVAELPDYLEVVNKLSDTTQSSAIRGVTLTYRTSDKSVASVSKTGEVKAKKEGTVTITVTVRLYDRTIKTFDFTFNVVK